MDLSADAADFQRVERLQRRSRLAQQVAESRKIVMPDQVTGAGAHRLDVECRSDLPHPAAFESRRGAAVQDAIEINPADRRQPGVELVANALGGKDADSIWPQIVIDGTTQHFRLRRAGEIEMRGLRQCMHARVGSSRPMDGERLSTEFGDRGFERFLNRKAVRLALPADQPAAVILDSQLVAGHGSLVPGRIGNPRRKAGASSAARPGRCSRKRRRTPSPHAIDRRSSSTVPSTPPAGPGRSTAACTRILSLPVSKKDPGQGSMPGPAAPDRSKAAANRADPLRGRS